MINILTRTHRTDLLKNCVESVRRQTYPNIRMTVSVDREELLPPTIEVMASSGLNFEIIRVENNGKPYSWNLYCNELKSRVKEGWFFYLDDDDILINRHCLARLREHLSADHGTICQFLRNGRPKPKFTYSFIMGPEHITKGKIGGGCAVLHHTHKDLAQWDDKQAADYRFIRDVQKKLPLHFVPLAVTRTLNNGRHGQ